MTSSKQQEKGDRNGGLRQSFEAPKTDFSIDHILNRAGNKQMETTEFVQTPHEELMTFSWLHCTRYCPPKLPRTQKKEGPQKRQLGRHPRIPFSSHQLAVLEEKFKQSPYLSSAEVTQLSRTLHLADIRVKIWFQNRRARERRERNEQETQQLKPYNNDIKHKERLSNEIPGQILITTSFNAQTTQSVPFQTSANFVTHSVLPTVSDISNNANFT